MIKIDDFEKPQYKEPVMRCYIGARGSGKTPPTILYAQALKEANEHIEELEKTIKTLVDGLRVLIDTLNIKYGGFVNGNNSFFNIRLKTNEKIYDNKVVISDKEKVDEIKKMIDILEVDLWKNRI